MPWRLAFLSLAMAHPLTVGPAEAHPERAALGLKLRVEVQPETVDLFLVVEIPVARLALESKDPGFPEAKLTELRDSLWVRLDGERLPTEAVVVEKPVRESGEEAGTAELEVHVRAALPHPSGVLTIENGAYPLNSAIYATAVEVSGQLVVVQTSLAKVEAGEVRDNRNGAWIRDEDARRTRLEIRPGTFWEKTMGNFALTERMEGRLKPTVPAPLMALLVITLFGLALFWKKR